jgi:hypothetical protein
MTGDRVLTTLRSLLSLSNVDFKDLTDCDHVNKEHQLVNSPEPSVSRMRQVEGREWWLWGFAVAVTLVLTFGILSFTFPGFHLPVDGPYALTLKEWVRGLAALVLVFDIYTVYQHLQLQRVRRQ